MSVLRLRFPLLLVLGSLTATTAVAAPPAPCSAIPAESWSSVMGYKATATPGEMNCTYEGKGGGGQFRIIGMTGSSAESEISAKRMREHQMHQKGSHNANLNVVDFEGQVVFSIALFQKVETADTASQLQKLVAAAKQHLPK